MMKLNSHIFISNKFKISYLKVRDIFVRFNLKFLALSSPIKFYLIVFEMMIELYEFECDRKSKL